MHGKMEDIKYGHIPGAKVERTVMGRKSEKNFKARIYSAVNPMLRFHFFLYSVRIH